MSHRPFDLITARYRFGLLVVVWGSVVGLSAATGVIQALPTPVVPLVLGALIAVPVGLYAQSARMTEVIMTEDLRWLTLFHVWRLPAGLAFLWYGAQGEIPSLFATTAGWGDVAAGVLSVGTVAMLPRCRAAVTRAGYVAFHVFGMLEFVVAVGTGFVFSVLGNPLMDAVRVLPLALIVFFGVPVTGSLGIATLHRLVRAPAQEPSPAIRIE